MNTQANLAIKQGIYRHYKGNIYRVIGIAIHSETGEKFVTYEALYNNPKSKMWVRPLSMFTEEIRINGKMQPRFEYIEDSKHAK